MKTIKNLKPLVFITLCLLIIASPSSAANEPYMVKDINPEAGDSYPRGLTASEGRLFFTADDGTYGMELWISDGNYDGTMMVKDIYTDTNPSIPISLTDIQGTLYFQADDSVHGNEPWISDGTTDGTMMLRDIHQSGGSNANQFVAVDGKVFFVATDGGTDYGNELWITDGTEGGTEMVLDIAFGPRGSDPAYLTDFGGILFFSAFFTDTNDVLGTELMQSDGSPAGTMPVMDIYPGEGSSHPSQLTTGDGLLFFSAMDSLENGRELWISDGSEGGTMQVTDIYPGGDSYPDGLTNINGAVYFSANDGTNGTELWVSDGTMEGTMMVKNINPYPNGDGFMQMVNEFIPAIYGELFFFFASDGDHGIELWISDGSYDGTQMVRDICPELCDSPSGSGEIVVIGDTLYFAANDGTNGTALWQSDGTENGTYMVKDIDPDANSWGIDELTAVAGTLFFSGYDGGTFGQELWAYTPNQPPYTPYNPTPVDSATGVSITPTLSWSGGDPDADLVSYTVNFGEAKPPTKLWCTTVDITSCADQNANTPLKPKTTYYWQVVAEDTELHATQGPIWSFTTEEPVVVMNKIYLPLIISK